jgi:dATP pyrophosphohydrolase
MARAPFQCLILPYIIEDEVIKYGVFKRSDHGFWQFISGGGEDNETPLEAAHRECYEEAEIPMDTPIYPMDSNCSIPAEIFCDEYKKNWGEHCYVVTEYSFAMPLESDIVKISKEHSEYRFVEFNEAMDLLKHDSNKTALRELRARIKQNNFKK